MAGLRDHESYVIEDFGGLWDRGDKELAPGDHFIEAQNVQYFSSGFETRNPLDLYMASALGATSRIYDYVMETGQSLLVYHTGGLIYHIVNGVATQILSIPTMEDFGFIAIAGRAYITPFRSFQDAQGMNYELGVPSECVYVYKGDGTPARRAGGFPPTNSSAKPFLAYNSVIDGVVTEGLHSIAVTYMGGQSGPVSPGSGATGYQVFRMVNAPGEKQIQLDNIPIGPGGTTSRVIQMSQVVKPETFYTSPPVYFTVLTIADNTTTSALINIKDADMTAAYTPGGTAAPTTNALFVTNSLVEGFCDLGFHLIGVVYETDTGYLTSPGPEFFGGQTYIDTKKSIRVSNIPVSPNAYVKKRHLVSTQRISFYNGDQKGYQFFFIPEGNIENNTDTEKLVKYYDSDLVDDASHLIDNFSEIPAGVNLNTYHSRMVVVGEYGTTESLAGIQSSQVDNRSVARISAPGEPEAISKVDGLIIAPRDGNPLTHCQEFRDVLYLFKKIRTYAYSDNQEEPSSWIEEVIDQGCGCPVHGIATVLDSGGVNIDFLLIVDLSGLMIFNGVYSRPELSWKIENYWKSLSRNEFRKLQIVNDSLNKRIWISLPPPLQNYVLHADYGDGLDAKNIKWSKWKFDNTMNGLALIETDKLVLTSDGIYYINPVKANRYDTYYPNVIMKIPDPIVRTAYLGE